MIERGNALAFGPKGRMSPRRSRRWQGHRAIAKVAGRYFKDGSRTAPQAAGSASRGTFIQSLRYAISNLSSDTPTSYNRLSEDLCHASRLRAFSSIAWAHQSHLANASVQSVQVLSSHMPRDLWVFAVYAQRQFNSAALRSFMDFLSADVTGPAS
jgi:hypothetical protein